MTVSRQGIGYHAEMNVPWKPVIAVVALLGGAMLGAVVGVRVGFWRGSLRAVYQSKQPAADDRYEGSMT
jgi:hypothetical protein